MAATPSLGSETALREREKSLKALAILVVIGLVALVLAFLWDGIQSQRSKSATLGNRDVALASLWLNCRNYQTLHPNAPIEDSCKDMPAHPPALPPKAAHG